MCNEKIENDIGEINAEILKLQMSALSRVNFCFEELKRNPSLMREPALKSVEEELECYNQASAVQKDIFAVEMAWYIRYESTVEARAMLIINYLAALLIREPQNHISIHKNHQDASNEIAIFEKDNKKILNKIKNARNKLYSHIDLNYLECLKSISFDELGKCIKFLNKLFDYRFENIQKYAFGDK